MIEEYIVHETVTTEHLDSSVEFVTLTTLWRPMGSKSSLRTAAATREIGIYIIFVNRLCGTFDFYQ